VIAAAFLFVVEKVAGNPYFTLFTESSVFTRIIQFC